MSLSLALAGCAGPQQLQNYSSRQGSLAEALFYKVQYKWTVGSPRDLAGWSRAKFKPKQPFMLVNAKKKTTPPHPHTRTHTSAYRDTSLLVLVQLCPPILCSLWLCKIDAVVVNSSTKISRNNYVHVLLFLRGKFFSLIYFSSLICVSTSTIMFSLFWPLPHEDIKRHKVKRKIAITCEKLNFT